MVKGGGEYCIEDLSLFSCGFGIGDVEIAGCAAATLLINSVEMV
jgi:hypothetical protein